jgi:hypothetical protein
MSEGKLNEQTGVYRWADKAILEDWNRPPAWFTEPFIDASDGTVPQWLLDLYEKWANNEAFFIPLSELPSRSHVANIAFNRLVRQPGFQWYPKEQGYRFLPAKEGYMDKPQPLVGGEEAIVNFFRTKTAADAPKLDPAEAAKVARELGRQYRSIMQTVLDKKQNNSAYQAAIADALANDKATANEAASDAVFQGQQAMYELGSRQIYNGDPKVPIKSLTVSEQNRLGTLGRPIGPEEYADQTTSDKPLIDKEILKPIAGIDAVPAKSVNIRTPKNSNKAAWSSKSLRALQSNITTYDAEVAQLFNGIAQILSSSLGRKVSQEELDFDVNFGSPIQNNQRQLSVTVRKPIECRVAVTQSLQDNGTMVYDAEVWDMRGIPDGSKYKGSTRTAVSSDSVANDSQKLNAAEDNTPPKKDIKRPRQVRI